MGLPASINRGAGNASVPVCLYSAVIQRDAARKFIQSESSSPKKERCSMVNLIAKKLISFFVCIRNLAPLSADSESRQLVLRTTLAVNSRY